MATRWATSPDGEARSTRCRALSSAPSTASAGASPPWRTGHLQSAHGGYDGITPDQNPVLGAAGPDGFYLDCGHSGTGFKTAPAIGLCMAELILDGAATTVDISMYTPTRFAAGKLIKGNYDNIWR